MSSSRKLTSSSDNRIDMEGRGGGCLIFLQVRFSLLITAAISNTTTPRVTTRPLTLWNALDWCTSSTNLNVSLQKRRNFTITHDHNKEVFFLIYNERKIIIIIIIKITTSRALVCGPCGHGAGRRFDNSWLCSGFEVGEILEITSAWCSCCAKDLLPDETRDCENVACRLFLFWLEFWVNTYNIGNSTFSP